MDRVNERAREELQRAVESARSTGVPMSTLEKAAFLQGFTLGYVARMEDQEIALRREIAAMTRVVECAECDPGTLKDINHHEDFDGSSK